MGLNRTPLCLLAVALHQHTRQLQHLDRIDEGTVSLEMSESLVEVLLWFRRMEPRTSTACSCSSRIATCTACQHRQCKTCSLGRWTPLPGCCLPCPAMYGAFPPSPEPHLEVQGRLCAAPYGRYLLSGEGSPSVILLTVLKALLSLPCNISIRESWTRISNALLLSPGGGNALRDAIQLHWRL